MNPNVDNQLFKYCTYYDNAKKTNDQKLVKYAYFLDAHLQL